MGFRETVGVRRVLGFKENCFRLWLNQIEAPPF